MSELKTVADRRMEVVAEYSLVKYMGELHENNVESKELALSNMSDQENSRKLKEAERRITADAVESNARERIQKLKPNVITCGAIGAASTGLPLAVAALPVFVFAPPFVSGIATSIVGIGAGIGATGGVALGALINLGIDAIRHQTFLDFPRSEFVLPQMESIANQVRKGRISRENAEQRVTHDLTDGWVYVHNKAITGYSVDTELIELREKCCANQLEEMYEIFEATFRANFKCEICSVKLEELHFERLCVHIDGSTAAKKVKKIHCLTCCEKV